MGKRGSTVGRRYLYPTDLDQAGRRAMARDLDESLRQDFRIITAGPSVEVTPLPAGMMRGVALSHDDLEAVKRETGLKTPENRPEIANFRPEIAISGLSQAPVSPSEAWKDWTAPVHQVPPAWRHSLLRSRRQAALADCRRRIVVLEDVLAHGPRLRDAEYYEGIPGRRGPG